VLWPATATTLDRVARDGPLPRLDAVIGATAALAGGTEALFEEFGAWAATQDLHPGTTLALARLHEAFGHPETARHLYQLTAFMAPEGPVVDLIRRLPIPDLPIDLLRESGWIPLEWRSSLREVIIQLRTRIAGIRPPTPVAYTVPETAAERAAIQSAGRTTARWREAMGMTIPIRMTRDPLSRGIGVRNEPEPLILISGEFILLPEPERSFRLALAATTVASGLALLEDSYPGVIGDLVDALDVITTPRRTPASDGSAAILEGLANAGFNAAQLKPELRSGLINELEHWRHNIDQLDHVIRRARLLLATYVSGRLDGALLALARDGGVLRDDPLPDGTPVLDTEDARWLLLSVGVLGAGLDLTMEPQLLT